MLTQNDYRAALLQAYKAMRHLKGPIYSYEYAKAIIKPLPDDRETWLLRRAFNEYTQLKRIYTSTDARLPRLLWRISFQFARGQLQ